MNAGALAFMLTAWVVVLGILVWSYTKLLRQPRNPAPPPQEAAEPGD